MAAASRTVILILLGAMALGASSVYVLATPERKGALKTAARRVLHTRSPVSMLSSETLRPLAVHAQTPTTASSISPQRALLNRYCIACHNERATRAADPRLMLDKMNVDDVADGEDSIELWEKVVRKLRGGSMPPAGSRRPDAATYETFVDWLETQLDRAAAEAASNPGRTVAHRLNRTEYANAVRDVFGIEIDASSMLPTDESGYGFDNIANVLSFSPTLFERYMFAAQRISQMAVPDPEKGPMVEIYRVSPYLDQTTRMSDDLPFGSRGGTAFRHYFPVDGEYTLRVRLDRGGPVATTQLISGLANREQIDVRVDGELVRRFTVGGECVGSNEPKCITPPGVTMVSEYELTADEHLVVRLPVKAGTRQIGVMFAERTAAAVGGTARRVQHNAERGRPMMVERIEIAGPLDVAAPKDNTTRPEIFVCEPMGRRDEDDRCAEKILTMVASRAYRRPVTDLEVQTLLGLYQIGRDGEGSFDGGIRLGLERILVSPSFLFRMEETPAKVVPGVPYRLSDVELASRLSFFLWSSIPDDKLLDLAAAGQLSAPGTLEQQVLRMLRDPRATESLVRNFAFQWLMLRDLRALYPDSVVFPEFNDSLRTDFLRETELLLDHVLREDRSITELLSANYTFVNERLAQFYGIPHVYGTHFRRVPLPKDSPRGGLLGHASVLTVTSYSTRTSSVVRGQYVLTNFLGTPPPPPPPNIPDLEDDPRRPPAATLRDRMAQHASNPVCASCHSLMDPIGFALENFNGIGQWRTHDGKLPIDASGVFPDGTKFNGVSELRNVLLSRREAFVRTFTEKLLTYALGRGLQYSDMPALRKIIRGAAPNDYSWSSLILGIVKSDPFQMKAASEGPTMAAERRTGQ